MMNSSFWARWVACWGLAVAGAALAQPVDGRAPSTRVKAHAPAKVSAAVPAAAVGVQKPAEPSVREVIGLIDARRRLRGDMPTGRGVVFAHVEGTPGAYAPKLDGPGYRDVMFSLVSGPSAASGHATTTARFIYGDKGLAPGVEVVQCLTAGDFMNEKYLRSNTPGVAPVATLGTHETSSPRVFTHSWIGDPPRPTARRVLRRLDYQIDTHDVIVVVGVNNGRQTPVPALLGSAYNVLAVGTTTGKNSGGYTRGDDPVDGPGRCKPDLAAPTGLTSYTTPVVAACAGLLVERADTLTERGVVDASRSEVIKAALLGGCTKPKNWAPDPGHSLDAWMGAGVVNIDRSLRIMKDAALPMGKALKRRFGWSFVALVPGSVATWDLTLPAVPGPVTLTAVWHRRIDARQAMLKNKATGETAPLWLDAPRSADFDLRLVSLNDGSEVEVAASASRVDNVELVVAHGLEAGAYRIEVVRQNGEAEPAEAWDVALTWAIDLPKR
ncbi:MAG: hypothetical protein V3V20_06165 [Algisphaera sp.]